MAQRTGFMEYLSSSGLGRRRRLLIPQAKKAGTIPSGSCDREGDLAQAVIGLAVPDKAISEYHYAMRLSVPFSNKHGAGRQVRPLPVETLQPIRHRRA